MARGHRLRGLGVLVAAGMLAATMLLGPAAAEGQARVAAAAAAPRDPVVVAAGQIAGRGRADSATAKLLDRLAPDVVLALGDNVDGRAGEPDFKARYGPTWGRWKEATHPVPGDGEYRARGARGYFGYFGAAAGA